MPKEARKVAGEFILAAAGREDLERAWQIAHPDLKRDCGCTKKQWLTGNINVQYFPTAGLQGANFTVDEVAPDRVVLEVLLTPKKGSEVPPTAFYIGLKEVERQVARRLLGAALGDPGSAAGLSLLFRESSRPRRRCTYAWRRARDADLRHVRRLTPRLRRACRGADSGRPRDRPATGRAPISLR